MTPTDPSDLDEDCSDEGDEDGADATSRSCAMHGTVVAGFRCKSCKRFLCDACSKGSKAERCRWCVAKREQKKRPGFCRTCYDSSRDTNFLLKGPGVVSLAYGIRHYNARERCERCGSFVTTLWVCILVRLPLIPLASYRCLKIGEKTLFTSANYIFRRVPMTRERLWPTILFMPLALAGVGFLIWVYITTRPR